MSEQEPGKKENRRPPSGPVSSPRAYFGRASRAATGALRTGITDSPEAGPAASPRRPTAFRAGDPALRLFAGFALPLAPTTPLTGAMAALTGIRDGEHERLFIDLGTSLVRATPQRDPAGDTLRLVLSRTQSAETYSALLASLRYVNDAPAPTPGPRRIALEIVDASGQARDAAEMEFSVGEEPREAAPAPDVAPAEAAEPDVAALAAAAPGAGEPAAAPAADERIVLGESFAFSAGGGYTVFWWPSRLPAPAERARRAPQAAGPAPDAGAFFSAGGKLYRVFESPPEPPLPAAPTLPAAPLAVSPGVPAAPPAPAPLAASAILLAQTPVAANDSAPTPQRAANDSVWVPGRGVPPPGFARAPMLRLEDIFGSDMQDAIARRLIDLRIASAGG